VQPLNVVVPSCTAIDISYAELKEIGRNPSYPLDGSYKLIDSGTARPFTGILDGNGQTIKIEQFHAYDASYTDSFYRGNIAATGTSEYGSKAEVAAFVGAGGGVSFLNCYSAGNVASNGISAGFVASSGDIKIKNSLIIDGTISGEYRDYAIGSAHYEYDDIDIDSSKASHAVALGTGKVLVIDLDHYETKKSTGLAITTSDMTDPNTYINEFGWDFTNIWEMGSQYPELR
jgi:hypothetical protein